MKYLEPAKEIDVYGKFDVIVVGGGCAGFSAAIAAAENGAKTLIIERFPYFGGTATASLMAKINGFRNQVEPDGIQTTKGLGERVILNLKQVDGLGENFYKNMKIYEGTKGKLSFSYVIDTEKFKYVTLKMVKESGVKILFHTYFSDVIKEENRVIGIIFDNKSGRQAAFADVIIDTTGDGDVSYKAGVPFWQTKHDEAIKLEDMLMYKIIGHDPNAEFLGCKVKDTMVMWGPSAGMIDGTNADELTQAEINVRLKVFQHLEEKKKDNPCLKDSYVVETGPLIGVKQTRFIEGLYQITGDDILSAKIFEDSIAMASKPIIEYYGYRRYLKHDGYEIPYRCLLPKNVEGLIVAGRCISSDQPAFESWRSMAPCMSLGEAAGTAAAIAVKDKVMPKQVDIKKLQRILIDRGAEIGQSKRNFNL